MRVLVACEESQEVCKAFWELGHEAYSCDIEPCSGGRPEWHLRCDALELLKMRWDMILAFPPCTYLSNAGAKHLFRGGVLNRDRYQKGLEAKEFFLKFLNADCPHICVENPGFKPDLRNAAIHSGGTTLDVRAPGSEENQTLAKRIAAVKADQYREARGRMSRGWDMVYEGREG